MQVDLHQNVNPLVVRIDQTEQIEVESFLLSLPDL